MFLWAKMGRGAHISAAHISFWPISRLPHDPNGQATKRFQPGAKGIPTADREPPRELHAHAPQTKSIAAKVQDRWLRGVPVERGKARLAP